MYYLDIDFFVKETEQPSVPVDEATPSKSKSTATFRSRVEMDEERYVTFLLQITFFLCHL